MKKYLTIFCLIWHSCLAGTATQIGDFGRYFLPISSLVYTAHHHDAEGLKQFGLTFGSSLALTSILKSTIKESRPDHSSYNAFPSGHTVWAFSSATYLHRRYGWQVGIPAYAIATAVGYSRVASKRHHLHDVIIGAGIGITASFLFTKSYQSDTVGDYLTILTKNDGVLLELKLSGNT